MGGGAALKAPGAAGTTRSLVAVVGHAVDLDASANGRGARTALALPQQIPTRALSLVPRAPRGTDARDPQRNDLIVGHVTLGPVPPSYGESGLLPPGSGSAARGALDADAAVAADGENENDIAPPVKGLSEAWLVPMLSTIAALAAVLWSLISARRSRLALVAATATSGRRRPGQIEAPTGYEAIGRLLVSTDLNARPILVRCRSHALFAAKSSKARTRIDARICPRAAACAHARKQTRACPAHLTPPPTALARALVAVRRGEGATGLW